MNNSIYDIKLDDVQIPAYRQLADGIYRLMEEGSLQKEEKLPSVRQLARKLNISNSTVVAAYRLLEERHAVSKRGGSGTYCTDISAGQTAVLTKQKFIDAGAEIKADFTKTSVSETLFPVAKFRDVFNTVLERDMGEAFSYQPSEGYQPLRQSIAALLEGKAIKTGADRVQIISGSQQGIDLVVRAVLREGDTVLCEKYTYLGAVNAILAQKAKVIPIDMDSGGLCLEETERAVKKYAPKLLYIMPCFQTPTGINYSLERKRALLNLAYKYGFYIIEEDNVGDFNYSKERITPLKALDYKNKVIYIKSFSKILMPGLRLGYAVLPKAISENVAGLKYSTDISTSGFIQRAFDLFIGGRGRQMHMAEIISVFRKKYSLAYSLAQKHLGRHFDISRPEGGLILWLRLKDKTADAKKLCFEFAKNGVAVIPGDFYTTDDENIPCIALSFADIDDETMKLGFEIMEKTLVNLSDI